MKPTTLLLTASLVANTALVAFVATRPSDPATPRSGPLPASLAAQPTTSGASSATPAPATSVPVDSRDLAVGRALTRFQQRLQAARTGASSDDRWWRPVTATRQREEELAARRELAAALQAALGDDLGLGGADAGPLAFLSSEKRAALLRINQDYEEMMAKYGANGGLQLASDKEKLRLLRAERDRDIAALLSPSELAAYEMRTSASAATLRNRYGDAIQTEDDFRKLYALQKAFDEKFPVDAFTGRVTPEALRARADAQQQLQADMRTAVGDASYAALRRSADSELRALDGLVSRLNLPVDTTTRVATSRETYSAESQRINADAALSLADRRAQLQALGTRARSELTTTLGAEVAEAYAPRANWVGLLQNGLAFSTTPIANSPGSLSLAGGAAPSVYPVMPAGGAGPGGAPGTRQVVNMITSSTESSGSPGGGTFFLGGAPVERTGGTMQVISVSNTSTTTHGDATTTTNTPTTTPKP